MIIKVLLVDPSIGFAVGIKRALEQPGGYHVVTFANGQAALDLVRTELQDVAVLDFEPDDMTIEALIAGLRTIQPDLVILVTPRTDAQLARVPSLDVQNSISKPYLVRQLIPVIRATLAERARQNAAGLGSTARPATPVESTEAADQPNDDDLNTPPLGVPIMQGTDDFDAALASLTPQPTQMFPTPDDSFHRHLSALQASVPTTTAGLRKTLENFALPPNDEDSTLAEAIGATAAMSPIASDAPEIDSARSPLDELAERIAQRNRSQQDAHPSGGQTAPLGTVSPTRPLGQTLQTPQSARTRTFIDPPPQTRLLSQPPPPVAQTKPLAPLKPSSKLAKAVEQSSAQQRTETMPEVSNPALPPAVDTAPIPEPPPISESSFMSALAAVPSSEPDPAESDSDLSDPDSAAEIAARLTHLAIQSTAYATILTRAGMLVASAGDLSELAIAGVVETIAEIWQTADEDDAAADESGVIPPRIRYIQVPGVGDFALYSIRTIDELYLSVLFPADTSLRLIRQQARRLIGALEAGSVAIERVPSVDDEPAAAKTQHSRPTEPLVPSGWRETLATQGIDPAAESIPTGPDQTAEPVADAPQAPLLMTIPDVPYSPYTLMWLPQYDTQLTEIADLLPGWIQVEAAARAWKVVESTVSAHAVSVRIDLPADQTPSGAIDTLQRATAEKADAADLWSDAYYVVASERAVTPFEIEQFVDYRLSTNR